MLLRIIILLNIIFIFLPSYSQNKNLESIIINADDVIIDKKTSSSIFTGHVILWFDNGLIIETDKIILTTKKTNEKESIKQITMPNKVRAIKDGDIIAEKITSITLIADSAEYIEDKSELRLNGKVSIQENNNFVKCNELIYYTNITKLSTNGK